MLHTKTCPLNLGCQIKSSDWCNITWDNTPSNSAFILTIEVTKNCRLTDWPTPGKILLFKILADNFYFVYKIHDKHFCVCSWHWETHILRSWQTNLNCYCWWQCSSGWLITDPRKKILYIRHNSFKMKIKNAKCKKFDCWVSFPGCQTMMFWVGSWPNYTNPKLHCLTTC